MIELKAPKEEKDTGLQVPKLGEIDSKLNPDAYYLKQISNTLKDILAEMRKRNETWTT